MTTTLRASATPFLTACPALACPAADTLFPNVLTSPVRAIYGITGRGRRRVSRGGRAAGIRRARAGRGAYA
ncbi:hypothetical protein GCM10010094_01820 [Streptomyces flaveus]|uniref:Uncharacterized protein n=1 Tax=Streptomyces flaveus TaxID=66370 RepID=A0A917QDS7_9ACTN|nr:hypothetical protein GCM10010094_01820 [Streptomyces flaveus]